MEKKERFPIISFIALIYAIIATLYVFSLSEDISDSLGYGIAQLGYALFIAATFTGKFRIFKIHKRLHAFGLAVALFVVGVVLINM